MSTEFDCTAAMQQLWDFLDEELTPERMDAMREHLGLCADCEDHAELQQAFLAAVAATGDGRPPCPEKVRERILGALRGAGFTPTRG